MILQKVMKCCTWKDATIFSMSLIVAIQLLVSVSPDIAKASAFDDFNHDRIDGGKWAQPESIRLVENGALSMAISGHADQNNDRWLDTHIKAPNSITKLQATVTIEAYQLDPDITTEWSQLVSADVFGTFYKSTADGDIEAGVVIIDINDGKGLKAWCWAESEDTGTIEKNSEFAESMSIETGHPYILAIEYNQAGNAIICSIQDGSNPPETTILNVSAATYSGPPTSEEKGLSVWYEFDGTSDADISIAAVFDDIETQAGAYDDFTSNTLRPTKWNSVESKRKITNNSLELSQYNYGSPYELTNINTADGVSGTNYYQASIQIDSSSSLSEINTGGQATMGGFFYNDLAEGGTNYLEGDHIGVIALMMLPGDVLVAEARIFRCDNADCSNTGDPVFSQEFTTTPVLNTQYTVSIKNTGDSLIFKMNNEPITHVIAGNRFTSFSSLRGLEVGVWSGTGEPGNMTAFFDNIFFEEKAFPWAMFLPAITGMRQ